MKNLLHLTACLLFFFACSSPFIGARAQRSPDLEWLGKRPAERKGKQEELRTMTGPLKSFINRSECGLNFKTVSAKLTNRQEPFTNITAELDLTGVQSPNGVEVLAAYLYWIVEGNNENGAMTFSGPQGSYNINGTLIGKWDEGKCWRCNYTMHYRANVTDMICKTSPDGKYELSGYPSSYFPCPNPPNCAGGMFCPRGDTDGATLLVIYKDYAADYYGSLRIDDGCVVHKINQPVFSHVMNNIDVCEPAQRSTGFMIIGDFQANGTPPHQIEINNQVYPVTPSFYNFLEYPAGLVAGQISIPFGAVSGGDCYSVMLAGAYVQTRNCPTTCQPQNNNSDDVTNGSLDTVLVCEGGSLPPDYRLEDYQGVILHWEYTEDCDNGVWSPLNHSGDAPPNDLPLTQEVCIRAVSNVDGCVKYSTLGKVNLTDKATPGAVVGGGAVCAGAEGPRLTLTGYVGDIQFWESSENDNCQNGSGPWTRINHTAPVFTPSSVNAPTCYRAFVKDGQCPAEASAAAYVAIREAQQQGVIEGDNVVCDGSRPSTLRATDFTGDVVRWEYSEICDIAANWKPIDNTRATYRPEVIEFPTCFRAVIQEGSCQPLPTPPLLIEIVEGTIAGNIVADPETVCEGENSGTLTLQNFRGNIERWEFSTNDFATVQTRSGDNPYLFENLTETTDFRAVVRAGNCASETTEPIQVTVVGNASAGRVVGNQTICAGAVAEGLQLVDYDGEIKGWELSTDNGQSWDYLGASGVEAFIPPPLFENTLVRALVSQSDCPPIPSIPAEIQVKPGATPGFVTGGAEICRGEDAPELRLQNFGGDILQWESRTPNSDWTVIEVSEAVFQPEPPAVTSYYRALVESNDCPGVYSAPDSIIVWQRSAAGAISGGGAFCEGARNLALELTGQIGEIISWERSDDNGANWRRVASSGEKYVVQQLQESAQYRATVKNGVCPEAASQPVALSADPPTIAGQVTGGVEICAKELNDFLELTGQRGQVVRWEFATEGNSWQPIDHQETTYFVTTLSGTTDFRAVVKNGACPEQASGSDRVTLIPPSVGGSVVADHTICRGERPNQIELVGYEGEILGWEASRNGGASRRDLRKPDVAAWKPMHLTITTQFRARVKKENCPEEYSDPVTVTVVRAAEGGYATAPYTSICAGEDAPQLRAQNFTGSIIQWEQSADNQNWSYAGPGGAFFSPGAIAQTTYFRAVSGQSVCGSANGSSVKIEVLPATKAGGLSGDFSVCKGGRSGVMQLDNYDGRVVRWERSEDRGLTWEAFNNNTDSYVSPPMFTTTFYRAVVKNGNCPEQASDFAEVWLVDEIAGGIVEGPEVYCIGSGDDLTLRLRGNMGVVIRWETTTDPLWRAFDTIPVAGPTIKLNDLTEDRLYRAVVKSGICGEVYSKAHLVRASEQPVLTLDASAGCANLANIYAEASGGEGFHTFSLTPEIQFANQTGVFENVPFDVYEVIATDDNGCADTAEIDVNLPVQTPDIYVTSVASTSAIIRWDAVPGADVTYEVYYRVYGAMSYEKYPQVLYEPYVVLTKLQHSAVYEIYVEAACGEGTLRSKQNEFFETLIGGYCDNPAAPLPGGIYVSAVTASTAWVHWSVIPGMGFNKGYIIAYGLKSVNPKTWPQFVVCNPTDAYFIQGLVPGMSYGVRVRTNCTNCTTALRSTDKRSEWSPVYDFETSGFFRQGAAESSFNAGISIYPNPNNGSFSLRFEEAPDTNPILSIFDLSGRRVFKQNLSSAQKSNNAFFVETSGLSPGAYILKISVGQKIRRYKMIIE